jgi:hypothetical protein
LSPPTLTQTDCKLLEALGHLDGDWTTLRVLLAQVNERELHDMPVTFSDLLERIHELESVELVDVAVSVRLAPPGRRLLAGEGIASEPRAPQGPNGSLVRADAPSPVEVGRPFAPDGAGDEWGTAA